MRNDFAKVTAAACSGITDEATCGSTTDCYYTTLTRDGSTYENVGGMGYDGTDITTFPGITTKEDCVDKCSFDSTCASVVFELGA